MSKIKHLALLGLLAASTLAFQIREKAVWQSKYVSIAKDGTLHYTPDAQGNVIPDFSRVGYQQGDREIPDIRVRKTVRPARSGSSQEIIQQAIDEVAIRKPDKYGFRGAILLKKGTYSIPGTLHIRQSGIVLRGEGDGENGEKGTVLVASGAGKRTLLEITGQGDRKEIPGTRRKITDELVPTGAMSFILESADGLRTGDNIIVYRPGTDNWIRDIKMDQIEARHNTKQWQAQEYSLAFERTITKIDGDKVYLDNPIVMTMESKYGGGEVYKYTFEDRISEVGVEHIRFESAYASDTDEDHGWMAVSMDKVENAWVRNTTSRYFGYAAVSLGSLAKQITVRDSRNFEPKSLIHGGRRYAFDNNGQLNLFMNLKATEGRHDYITGAKTLGPNVFYNCTAQNTHADIGPHHRWAVGTLYDNVTTDGEINVQDRGNWGSGHGWSGVTQVLWNCTAKSTTVQSPWASGKNYCIGLQGEKTLGRFPDRPDGEWEGQNQPELNLPSLYLAQLKARRSLKK
ncbi:hypothetical protein A3841_07495 [Pontibacter flavimaris]|uniref:Pectate lyase n=1 Tax=Pontibacter flavimaris TaxID=1797110 RepID=A0A1Q5PJ10_9BACT|nr:hypothetical protein A3841_07495 [Pontibacter flavimaris]